MDGQNWVNLCGDGPGELRCRCIAAVAAGRRDAAGVVGQYDVDAVCYSEGKRRGIGLFGFNGGIDALEKPALRTGWDGK